MKRAPRLVRCDTITADLEVAADEALASLGPAPEDPLAGIPFRIPILALANHPTGDGRRFQQFGLAPLPMPLMVAFETSETPHGKARIAGKITAVSLDENGTPSAIGYYALTPDGIQGAQLAANGMMPGVSIDGDMGEAMLTDEFPNGDYSFTRIRGATQTPFPAFVEARIEVDQADIDAALGLVASGSAVAVDPAPEFAPWRPPASAFADPEFDRLTPLTYSAPRADGTRIVAGHLASWEACHTTSYSESGACVTAPPSRSGYAYFNVGQIECDDGSMVQCGTLTFGTGHAALRRPNGEIIPAAAAIEHYANTGSIGAYVRAGEDAYGVWIVGVVEPELTDREVRQMLAAKASGDWRQVAGSLELIGALAVPKPAFPIPALATSAAGCEALVAAGAAVIPDEVPVPAAVERALAPLLPLAADAILAQLDG